MSVLSYLNVVIGAETTGLTRGLDRATRGVRDAGRRMQRVGAGMTAGITAPIAAIGVASFKMAADAAEAADKFDVVMGDSADRVRASLIGLHDTIPLTLSEMEGLSAGIQDMLVPMGVARDSAADMSFDFVKLAGDMGSLSNVPTAQVLADIQSALAGSSEPMRKYGVDTRIAALESVALEEGLIAQGEALDAAAMAQAVLIQTTRQTADAQGNAAATAGSAANQMKFLTRDVKDAGIAIGEALLPVMTPMVGALSKAVTWFTDLSPAARGTIVAVAGLAAVIGPLVFVLGTLLAASGPIIAALTALGVGGASVLALAAVAFGAVVAAGVAVIDNWKVLKFEAQVLVETIREWFGEKLTAIFDRVGAAVDRVKGFFAGMYDAVVGNSYVPDMVDEIGFHMGRLGDNFVEPARSAAEQVKDALSDIGNRGIDAIADFATGASQSFAQFAASAVKELTKVIAKLLIIKAINTFLPGVGSFLGLAGSRASGGPVTSNRPYLVGEQGAELFVPNKSGAVLSSPQTMAVAGGGGFDVEAALAVMGAPARELTPAALAERSYWKEFLRAGIENDTFRAG